MDTNKHKWGLGSEAATILGSIVQADQISRTFFAPSRLRVGACPERSRGVVQAL
jgi:hypothetical protein